jgi:hypothetical protein
VTSTRFADSETRKKRPTTRFAGQSDRFGSSVVFRTSASSPNATRSRGVPPAEIRLSVMVMAGSLRVVGWTESGL